MLQTLDIIRSLPPTRVRELFQYLDTLCYAAAKIISDIDGSMGDTVYWARALVTQCQEAREELLYLVPWVNIPIMAGAMNVPILERIQTLREITVMDMQLSAIRTARLPERV
jgi:hypothetical protein